MTRLLSTTTQVNKKATIISANYTLNQNVTARFFISSFFQDKYYSNYYIYETFLRYSKQNKQKPSKKESGGNPRRNNKNNKAVKKTKQNENHKHLGKDERETNFLCANI